MGEGYNSVEPNQELGSAIHLAAAFRNQKVPQVSFKVSSHVFYISPRQMGLRANLKAQKTQAGQRLPDSWGWGPRGNQLLTIVLHHVSISYPVIELTFQLVYQSPPPFFPHPLVNISAWLTADLKLRSPVPPLSCLLPKRADRTISPVSLGI